VVESLLRDELGATNINTLSFDQVSMDDSLHPLTDVAKCYLNMSAGKKMRAKDLCERIGWEHSIFFYASRLGTFRAVSCFGTYDNKATIEPVHVRGERLKWNMRRPAVYAPSVTFVHTQLPVNESFNRSDTLTDSGAAYGTAQIPMIELDTIRVSTMDGDANQLLRLQRRLLGDAGGGDSVRLSSTWDEIQPAPFESPTHYWTTDWYVVVNVTINTDSVTLVVIDWRA
jgi:hypothetical protein